MTDRSPAAQAKDLTLHMIGYSHIDPVWLWQWQEGLQEVKATFRSALDRMEEYPEFRFSISSAAFHEFLERNEPEMFEEIRRRVAEGRWEIVGGWWVEPDCNLPSGESFARHALYGQRFFGERVGARARVGFNPDAFGHNAMLPQILKRSGLDFYVFMRPQVNERDMPRLFWWESPDGSRVLAYRVVGEYNSPSGTLDDQVALCLPELGHPHAELLCFYGVGDHGGGPTRANIESIRALDAAPGMPHLQPSTVEAFFRSVLERTDPESIPVWRDEMQNHAVGCYSAHSGVKLWNRGAENALLAAEKLSSVAHRVTGQRYPDEFRQAWTDVLFNQMHDILPGTSLEPAYDDARDAAGEALAIAARAQNFAVQSMKLVASVSTRSRAFAPSSSSIRIPGPRACRWRWSTAAYARPIRWSMTRVARWSSSRCDRLASVTGWRHRMRFVADLPALGYRVFRVISKGGREPTATSRAEAARPQRPVSLLAEDTDRAEPVVLENSHLRLEIDRKTGLVRLVDKRTGEAAIPGGGARPVPIHDPSDTWGHRMHAFHDRVGEFELVRLMAMEQGPFARSSGPSIASAIPSSPRTS